jgi:hypothetical protein
MDEIARIENAFAVQRKNLATLLIGSMPLTAEVREWVERVSRKGGDNRGLAKECLLLWEKLPTPIVGDEIDFLESLYKLEDPRI